MADTPRSLATTAALLDAAYGPYRDIIERIALLSLRTLALEARERNGEAAMILLFEESDQGPHLLASQVLDAEWNLLDEVDGWDNDIVASNLDESNEGTWGIFACTNDEIPEEHRPQHRHDDRRYFLIGPILQATDELETP